MRLRPAADDRRIYAQLRSTGAFKASCRRPAQLRATASRQRIYGQLRLAGTSMTSCESTARLRPAVGDRASNPLRSGVASTPSCERPGHICGQSRASGVSTLSGERPRFLTSCERPYVYDPLRVVGTYTARREWWCNYDRIWATVSYTTDCE
jgi:hypothetical protein